MNLKHNRSQFNHGGASIVELLVLISIISILTQDIGSTTKKLTSSMNNKFSTTEVVETIKSAITLSRISNRPIRIILKTKEFSNESKLVFIFTEKEKLIIDLKNKNLENISIVAGSPFQNTIIIEPRGYVSPSSIAMKFKNRTQCTISISRLGATRHECKSL